MPSGVESEEVISQFYNVAGFQNILGCVNGTFIKIQAPSNSEPDYLNRKSYLSVNGLLLQNKADVNLFQTHGIAVCKSGFILVCQWNRKFKDQSVVKIQYIDDNRSSIVMEIESDKNQPLYICPTYIAENGNGDICVSDVRAVVVTDAGGMLRFRYQGNSRDFDPYGICCDSPCKIIVADMKNDKIHVIDKDGTFLHHVTYDGIKMPRAICIDENKKLYVGEWHTDTVKVIARTHPRKSKHLPSVHHNRTDLLKGLWSEIKQQQAVPLQIPYGRGDTPQRNRKERLQLGESRILWEDEDPLHRGCGSKFGFTPQGIAVTKSGGILICLWNNEFGERISGKVISIDGKLQIFIDKNRPLYVCPTYIVENGNGDICVSDVRAVVVTDAGGLLRFRYQGNSSSKNFYPYGICCDSSCNIIVADMNNAKIHVVEKDGEFLYHVTYDGIKMPRALCIDGNDRVYVGEWDSDAIKVIAR
uniref:Tripartite motif-containing protein 2 n=1 Tax=Magallana gigas TaxID=29159 RepID=A0A8W8NR21_MAGGI